MVNFCFKLVCRLSSKKQSSHIFGSHLVKLGLQILIHISWDKLFIFLVFVLFILRVFGLFISSRRQNLGFLLAQQPFFRGIRRGFFFFSLNSSVARSYTWRKLHKDFSMSFWTFWRDNFSSFLKTEQLTAGGHVSEVSWSWA